MTSHAELARALVSTRKVGTLATIALDPPGHPFASLVAYALGEDGEPLFLLSRLAVHTQHLEADARASLLVAEDGAGADPLALGRATLIGSCRRLEGDPSAARERFLAAHPDAARYVGFADFGFFRLEVASVRYVGGFGRMSWIDADAWRATWGRAAI